MANQFDAKIRFDPIAWRAYDRETKAVCLVTEGPGLYKWVVSSPGARREGSSTTASGARSACRRAVAKLKKAPS